MRVWIGSFHTISGGFHFILRRNSINLSYEMGIHDCHQWDIIHSMGYFKHMLISSFIAIPSFVWNRESYLWGSPKYEHPNIWKSVRWCRCCRHVWLLYRHHRRDMSSWEKTGPTRYIWRSFCFGVGELIQYATTYCTCSISLSYISTCIKKWFITTTNISF